MVGLRSSLLAPGAQPQHYRCDEGNEKLLVPGPQSCALRAEGGAVVIDSPTIAFLNEMKRGDSPKEEMHSRNIEQLIFHFPLGKTVSVNCFTCLFIKRCWDMSEMDRKV